MKAHCWSVEFLNLNKQIRSSLKELEHHYFGAADHDVNVYDRPNEKLIPIYGVREDIWMIFVRWLQCGVWNHVGFAQSERHLLEKKEITEEKRKKICYSILKTWNMESLG